jgi:ABC-type proline/glycine betaine transport system permease subunit
MELFINIILTLLIPTVGLLIIALPIIGLCVLGFLAESKFKLSILCSIKYVLKELGTIPKIILVIIYLWSLLFYIMLDGLL